MTRKLRRAWLWVASLLLLGSAADAREFALADFVASPSTWDSPAFLDGWKESNTNGADQFRILNGRSDVFGHDAVSVTGVFERGKLVSISIIVLDAGAWFGFVPDSQARQVAATKGPQFAALYRKTVSDVDRGLASLARSAGRKQTFVDKGALKHDVLIFHIGEYWARLTTRENHLVKITLARSEADVTSPLSAMRRTAKKEEQAREFEGRVNAAANGDRMIEGIPIFLQGDRAYCGVATLAMVMQFLGLRLDTEDYAVAAGIRFGSTYRSSIREVCEGAAELGRLRLPRTTQFDFERARSNIDAGFPVIVFRWWSQERDFLHQAFSKRYANDASALLPKPDLNDRKAWPTRADFAHSSVITGYNAERREVIFTESWGEQSRNRRMRIEEMEGTVYLAYYPRL